MDVHKLSISAGVLAAGSVSPVVGFCALVPSEHSSGQRTHRGGITHAGNTHLRTQLVESA